MTTIRAIKILDETVGWAITAEYDHPEQARLAWQHMERIDRRGHNNLGVFRHGLEKRPGSHDTEAVYVSAVSTGREGIEVAEHILLDLEHGRPHDLEPELDRAMLFRRTKAVLAGGAGMKIRRPEHRGARMQLDGTMIEPPPHRG